MSEQEQLVASVAIRTDRPTQLSFSQLYNWVIWQFPRLKGAGLCGAVRPPIANHGWYPALIRQQDKRVIVHGHLDREFTTPSDAADWLASGKDN
jgi:hypothetical protein